MTNNDNIQNELESYNENNIQNELELYNENNVQNELELYNENNTSTNGMINNGLELYNESNLNGGDNDTKRCTKNEYNLQVRKHICYNVGSLSKKHYHKNRLVSIN